jgi:hypothetical protein
MTSSGAGCSRFDSFLVCGMEFEWFRIFSCSPESSSEYDALEVGFVFSQGFGKFQVYAYYRFFEVCFFGFVYHSISDELRQIAFFNPLLYYPEVSFFAFSGAF